MQYHLDNSRARTQARCWLGIIVLTLFCAPSAAAQSKSDIPYLAEVSKQASNRNWYLRVTLSDSTILVGRARGFRSDQLIIGNQTVDSALITRIERRVRHNSGGTAGSFLGGLAGAVLIAAPLAALASDPDSNGGPAQARAAFIGATAFCVILGMLVGEALDPGDEGWLRVWPNR
jgi:hypothetical protein